MGSWTTMSYPKFQLQVQHRVEKKSTKNLVLSGKVTTFVLHMKKYKHLTKEQRYTISVCLRKKMSVSDIAKFIDVSKSTVSREIKRNLNMYRHYVWIDAQQFSDMRKLDSTP